MNSLMTIDAVRELLGGEVGRKGARNWLERNQVPVIDLGRGRALGLRWSPIDVLEAIEKAKKGGPKIENKKRPSFPKQHLIRGRNRDDVLHDLGLTENYPTQ